MDYLIPFETISDVQMLQKFLLDYKKIILKPLRGSGGKGVIYIELKENQYIYKTDQYAHIFNEKEFIDYFNDKLKGTYVAQKYIQSVTKGEAPFDIRAHLMKNGMGKWEISIIYARIGTKGGVTANISAGGSLTKLSKFLTQNFKESNIIRKNIEKFSIDFASELEKMYEDTFNEVGIDIALDDKGNIYIIEVNSWPGVEFIESHVVSLAMEYCVYMAKNRD